MADAAVDVTDDTIVEVELPEGFDPNADPKKTTPAAATTATTTAAATPAGHAATGVADEGVEALKKSLEEERRLRRAAEGRVGAAESRADAAARLAQQRDQEASEARNNIAASQMRETVSSLEAAKRDMQAAKAAHRVAHEAGDVDKMTDAQEAMSLAAASIRQFESKKVELEQQATRAAETRTDPATTAIITDPAESYLSAGSFSPRARQWLREHRDCLPGQFGGSNEKNAAMMRGHHLALGQGFAADSDEYYRVIEEQAGFRTPVSAAAHTTPAGGNGVGEGQAQQRRAPIPAAPPTNEPASASGQPAVTKRTFQLNKEMQEIALLSFPQEKGEDDRTWKKRAFGAYAYNLAEATKEGKIGRTTH